MLPSLLSLLQCARLLDCKTYRVRQLRSIPLLGRTGKTNITSQLVTGKFSRDSLATIGVEFGSITFKVRPKTFLTRMDARRAEYG